MAGNKSVYETAMKRAHQYAWSNQWERALKEYGRALSEFPADRTALRNMAQCHFRLKQWPQALASYESLLASDPMDAFAINRLAEIYLALGQQEPAQATYHRLADLYARNGQTHEAIRALRDLARVMPKNRDVHQRLLNLTIEVADFPAQAAEHLALSQIALEAGNMTEAQQHADAASDLDADNPEIRRWVFTVRRRVAESAGTVSLAGDADAMNVPGVGALVPGTHLFQQDAPEPPEVEAFVQQATEAAESGEYTRAMELYDQAVRAGAQRPSTFYAAGVLNFQMSRPDNAIAYLERALKDREFAMSANYMLGQCYSQMKNPSKAVAAFERALTLIDLTNLTRGEADELIELYSAAAEANMADNNPGRAASLFSTLTSTFKTRKWSHPMLPELEKKADELYNKSIQSKLLGISRGSAVLDADTVEAIVAPGPTGSLPAPAASAAANDNGAAPDRATVFMSNPGSNLRSITEYLRTSESSAPAAAASASDAAVGVADRVGVGAEHDGTTALPPSPTEILPGVAEQFRDLPALTMAGKVDEDMAVQLLIAEGEYAAGTAKWDAAIDSCFAVIALSPDYLPIHMMLGDIYLHQGKVDDAASKYQIVLDTYLARKDPGMAAEVCERLLQLQPESPALMSRLGMLLLETGKEAEAARALLGVADRFFLTGDTERALEEALKLKSVLPNSTEVALAAGTYQLILGQASQAAVELSRALHLNPGNDIALIRLYASLVAIDDAAQWDALNSVLERSSTSGGEARLFMEDLHKEIKRTKSPTLYYGLSVIAERAGLNDIAADALDQGMLALSLAEVSAPMPSWPLLETLMSQRRADIAINAKDWGRAAQHYRRAIELLTPEEGRPLIESPRSEYEFTRLADPVHLYYGLAEAYASQSNWASALEALKTVKSFLPEDNTVNMRLADIYFRQGHLTAALGELNDVLIHYQKKNDNDKTLETLTQMARLAPNNVAVRRKLGDLYLKIGMVEEGLAQLNTLAELQLKAGTLKDAIRTYQKAADLHYTMGQHPKAIGIYERIVRIAPKDLSARDQLINMYIQTGRIKDAINSERSLAELFIQEGRAEEAIAALHQLLALAPEDLDGHYLLAKQLTAIGEYGQAARLYGRLARLDSNNERFPVLQQEMQRMADEIEKQRKAARPAKSAKQAAARK